MSTKTRAGWVPEYDVRKGRMYLHQASGWLIRHCCNQAEDLPYYLIPPDKVGIVRASYGRGWGTLTEAMEDVEGLVSGRLVLDHGEMDEPGIRRAVTHQWYEKRTRMLAGGGGRP